MAADRRAQEDRLIQQMLTTSGYSQVDMRFVLALPANSPERHMLAQVECVWVGRGCVVGFLVFVGVSFYVCVCVAGVFASMAC